jgi:hypothetical protein
VAVAGAFRSSGHPGFADASLIVGGFLPLLVIAFMFPEDGLDQSAWDNLAQIVANSKQTNLLLGSSPIDQMEGDTEL